MYINRFTFMDPVMFACKSLYFSSLLQRITVHSWHQPASLHPRPVTFLSPPVTQPWPHPSNLHPAPPNLNSQRYPSPIATTQGLQCLVSPRLLQYRSYLDPLLTTPSSSPHLTPLQTSCTYRHTQ